MLLDFEKCAITSFEHIWPSTVVKCCFFHLTQNIWRHVQSVGLQSVYTHDEELDMRIRRIPALAFARPADVPDLFDQVAMDLPLTPEIGEQVDYFERTYIGRTLGHRIPCSGDVPYSPVEQPHRHALRTPPYNQRRRGMALQLQYHCRLPSPHHMEVHPLPQA
ncbi:hypothetical protein LOD99_1840 [Oopsacas minuta]|uniref:MULE transposase domain-containing protein n=1 Tax=Oopsacas minuta TaxID=111878 RepID=A0AAV7K4G6_9METZ|nr:hypothetical protein LOD99_1840 [Oopsacas minuta]